MGKISKYDIAYKGLKEGIHKFEYQIDDSFFELFDKSQVEKADISVNLDFEKRNNLMTLLFRIKGTVELACDRCLEFYSQPVSHKTEVFVKFGETRFDDSDEVLWVSPEAHYINTARLMYEYIILSIPVKHVHPDNKNGESTCNREMLDQIKKYAPLNRKEAQPDQRWDALKKLINRP